MSSTSYPICPSLLKVPDCSTHSQHANLTLQTHISSAYSSALLQSAPSVPT